MEFFNPFMNNLIRMDRIMLFVVLDCINVESEKHINESFLHTGLLSSEPLRALPHSTGSVHTSRSASFCTVPAVYLAALFVTIDLCFSGASA